MNSKNRFAKLLEELMSKAEIKNYVLAAAVQYDVSYISKWISGKLIPGEKAAPKVLREISECIVTEANPTALERLRVDYSIKPSENSDQLEKAIYDHLAAEYYYVKDQDKQSDSSIDSKTQFFPDINFTQYLRKMHHPVLRRVNSLNTIAMIDLKSLSYDNRVHFLGMNNDSASSQRIYPDVRFNLIINEESIAPENALEEVIFYLRLLVSQMHINFKIYRNPKAYGRAVFIVENEFAISGMIDDGNKCTSVITTEDPKNCSVMYNNLRVLLKETMKLFRALSAEDLFADYNYMHAIMTENQSWMIGHITELMLGDDLFEKILKRMVKDFPAFAMSEDKIRTMHKITQRIITNTSMRVLFCDSVFSYLAFSDEIDFYGYRVRISREDKLSILKYSREFLEKNENLNIMMAFGKFDERFYIANQSIFLSDRASYLRLNNNTHQSRIYQTDQSDIHKLFIDAFDYIWKNESGLLTDNHEEILEHIKQVERVI